MTHKDQAHAAIDRLVTHLEREATEHVHALDALRAECESLRTINGNLREEVARLTHLVEESRKIHDVNARDAKPAREVVRTTYCSADAMCQPAVPPWSGRHAIRCHDDPSTWLLYSDNGPARRSATEAQAIAWCLDGVLPGK